MTDEEALRWCEERTRISKALAEAFRLVGPPMARMHDEALLRLFLRTEDE